MTIDVDDLGPQLVIHAADPETGMRGFLVVDNTELGPAGGGTRMAPDVTVEEVASLARGMTCKFALLGMPRGGSKAGIRSPADPSHKRAHLRAFGQAISSLLATREVAVGPDLGVTVDDVREIYAGARVPQLRSGLFEQIVDEDPLAYHLTGHGVIASAVAASEVAGLPFRNATIAVEGFGQVGVGCCRRAVREGARVVAVSTAEGALYSPGGLDVERLMKLRRAVGDRCIDEYGRAQRLASAELYFLPVDVLVPGARPWAIHEDNCDKVQAKLVCSGGNITVTDGAQERLWARKVVNVPDFVANAGAAIASWVDFLEGTPTQAFSAIDRLIARSTRRVLERALETGDAPHRVATDLVREQVLTHRGAPRKSFAEAKVEIAALLEIRQ